MIEDNKDVIYKLIAGYTTLEYAGNFYIVRTPNADDLNESFQKYIQIYNDFRFDYFLDSGEIPFYLIKNDLWTFQDENNIKELEKSLNDCKLELFDNYGMPEKTVTKIRNRLSLIKAKYQEKLNIKHSLDKYTLNGLAEYGAEMLLFSRIVSIKDDNKVLEPIVLNQLINIYKFQLPSHSILRKIARSEYWRSIWSTNNNVFKIIGDDQRTLIMFTKMYENIAEHPKKPPDGVIQDDDMLDGWFLSLKRDEQKEAKENHKNALDRKHPNASEIFMFTDDSETAKQIQDMNDIRAKMIQEQIKNKMKTQEMVRDKDISLIRLEKGLL